MKTMNTKRKRGEKIACGAVLGPAPKMVAAGTGPCLCGGTVSYDLKDGTMKGECDMCDFLFESEILL